MCVLFRTAWMAWTHQSQLGRSHSVRTMDHNSQAAVTWIIPSKILSLLCLIYMPLLKSSCCSAITRSSGLDSDLLGLFWSLIILTLTITYSTHPPEPKTECVMTIHVLEITFETEVQMKNYLQPSCIVSISLYKVACCV